MKSGAFWIREVVGALLFTSACPSVCAQAPTEAEVWGYTTTATGTEVFDTLTEAESALLTVNDSLVRVGEPRVSGEEIGIVYRSDAELPPSEGIAWYACDVLDCEYSASSYEEAAYVTEYVVAALEAEPPSPGYCPTFEVV